MAQVVIPRLVLASTSAYRKALLERLGLRFEICAPRVDETPHEMEDAASLAARLAYAKAEANAVRFPGHLIIGSDQVADLDGQTMGKPGTRERNLEQLAQCAGKTVVFRTGLCVLSTITGDAQCDVVDYSVTFRALSREQIERYVDRETPYDCAGGFKSEGLGIALFKSMQGADPSALVGLPLIRLCEMLRKEGLEPLA